MFGAKKRIRERIRVLGFEIAEALHEFIRNNYTFVADKRYTGIIGFFRGLHENAKELEEYENYSKDAYYQPPEIYGSGPGVVEEALEKYKIDFYINESFSPYLIKLIYEKKLNHVEVYKNANIDRKLFSKIISNLEYIPSKNTVLAIAIGLKLNIDETEKLLDRAGYKLSKAILADVIVEYFIVNNKYDIFEINKALHSYGKTPLGSRC